MTRFFKALSRFCILFFFAFIIQAKVTEAADLPKTLHQPYVDQLSILEPATKQLIVNKNRSYQTKKEYPQVVVALIKSTEGDDIDSYAPNLFEQWKIGNKDYDNGILILYALNDGDRNVRIEVGYGLEDVITDSTAGNILENARANLKSSNPTKINQGITYTFNAVTSLIDKHYKYPTDQNTLSDEEIDELNDEDGGGGFSAIIGTFLILFFIFAIIRGRPANAGWLWWLAAIFDKDDDDDHFGGFGGGGFGGGSGGGFSGGGGSSGGGGASI